MSALRVRAIEAEGTALQVRREYDVACEALVKALRERTRLEGVVLAMEDGLDPEAIEEYLDAERAVDLARERLS